MKTVFLVTIAFMMIFVTLDDAAAKTETPYKIPEKPIRMAGRKFSKDVRYVKVNNNLSRTRVVETDHMAGLVPEPAEWDRPDKNENTMNKAHINKADDDNTNPNYGYYGGTRPMSITGTHHTYPSDRRPGGRPEHRN